MNKYIANLYRILCRSKEAAGIKLLIITENGERNFVPMRLRKKIRVGLAIFLFFLSLGECVRCNTERKPR